MFAGRILAGDRHEKETVHGGTNRLRPSAGGGRYARRGGLPKCAEIEARIAQLEPTTSRRSKASLTLMREFINTNKRLLDKIGIETQEEIELALSQVADARKKLN